MIGDCTHGSSVDVEDGFSSSLCIHSLEQFASQLVSSRINDSLSSSLLSFSLPVRFAFPFPVAVVLEAADEDSDLPET